MLNFHLTQEQLDIQKKAREFAIKEVLTVAWYYDEKDEIPLEVIRKASQAGLVGAKQKYLPKLRKITNFQAIQFKLAEMFQKVETARLLTWKAAWDSDQGQDNTVSASTSKLYASETALEVVNEALKILPCIVSMILEINGLR